MSDGDVVQEYFAIGDVCELTGLKPHVLRYWESQFRFLHPAKNRSGNRVYQRKDVELIQLVKHLLYVEKYTIDGARAQVEGRRRDGTLRRAARAALDAAVARDLEAELGAVLDLLAGRDVPDDPDDDSPNAPQDG
ncbi:MAG: MerR family transcriptional regulator [Gemmatimonadota bacterium]